MRIIPISKEAPKSRLLSSPVKRFQAPINNGIFGGGGGGNQNLLYKNGNFTA